MHTKSTNRLPLIDALRGLAVLGMIVFHFFFILDFVDFAPYEMQQGGWLILARTVQFLFIGLVGFSMTLSNRPYEQHVLRGLKILGLGMIVTLVTWLFVPEAFVRFGILHLIGTGIIIAAPLRKKKWPCLFLGIFSFLLGEIIKYFSTASLVAHFFGFRIPTMYALDYFPVFPWISLIFFGIFLGNFSAGKIFLKTKTPNLLTFFGRHSLLIYMIHVPIIMGALILLKIIPL